MRKPDPSRVVVVVFGALLFVGLVGGVVVDTRQHHQDTTVLLMLDDHSGPMHEYRLAEFLGRQYDDEELTATAQRLERHGYITAVVTYELGDLCGGTMHWEYSLTPKGQRRATLLRFDTGRLPGLPR